MSSNLVRPKNPSRRSILKLATAAVAAPIIIPSSALGLAAGTTAPSQRITLGFIGVGGHGRTYNMATFLQQEDCQVVAVCDVFASRCQKAVEDVRKKYGPDAAVRTFGDFRELLAAPGIDAVCISTPDHWHVPISLAALEAGKDVMCEKPTLTIAQGRALADLVTRKNAIYQVGLEDRSVIQYHMLAAWARNGALGDIKKLSIGLPKGTAYPKEQPAPVPADLNWEMWLGPAPFHPFTPTRTNPMTWREIRDYSGGMLTDWGAHLLDTAQVAIGAELSGPVEVEGKGNVPENSMTNVPIDFVLTYRYAGGIELEVKSGGVFFRAEGTRGWAGNKGWRGRLEASDDKILQTKYAPADSKLWPLPPGEHRDFLNCIKARRPTTYTAEHGQRLSTALHVGAIAMELGRKVQWDPKTESFGNDDAANALRSRPAREDWKKA